jgi:hypothetical protein
MYSYFSSSSSTSNFFFFFFFLLYYHLTPHNNRELLRTSYNLMMQDIAAVGYEEINEKLDLKDLARRRRWCVC